MATETFIQHHVIPDVVSPGAQLKPLSIKFKSGVVVELGNKLTPTQVKDQPEIQWETEQDALYTLIMTDPDATVSEFEHWVVVNIPGTDISKGDHIATFISSGPPKEVGIHRYVFLIYKQSGRINDVEHGRLPSNTKKGRSGFKTPKFVEKHGLGQPLFGNLYLCEYDEYVDELLKTFI